MKLLINIVITAIAVGISSYILPGVTVDSPTTALVVALVLGVVNAVLKPILVMLTLPITLFTFGLFTLIINALLISLVTMIVPGFQVANFLWALLFGLVLSFVGSILRSLLHD